MNIQRDFYLNQLIAGRENGLIKIITGIRRCGKSYLLFRLFHEWLNANGVDDNHIIEVALDDRSNKSLRNPDALLNYVKNQIKDKNLHYILLDEIQIVPEFTDVLNSLLHIRNTDVYVTGSNSHFLSTDVVTEFRGRGDEIRLHPLSFAEFCQGFQMEKGKAWKLVKTMASTIGSPCNPTKLANTFKSVKKVEIHHHTIRKYLSYLSDAFVLERSVRYDIKGKRYINTLGKYYFSDLGIRNALLGFRQQEENHIMENIIYNELRIRGYHVDIGTVEERTTDRNNKTIRKQYEVDFVANQGNKRYYIQSAFALPDEAKIRQETASLTRIDDSFKKIIVVKDDIMPKRDENGIVTIGIMDFLLRPDSMDY